MSRLSAAAENWKYSIPGGLLSAVFVLLSYMESKANMSLGAVFFIGIIVGFLSKRRYGTSKGTGILTGFIGAVPVVWILGQMLTATSGLSGPAWFTVAGTVMAIPVALCVGAFGCLLSAGIGEFGARIGGSITELSSTPDTN